MTHTISAAEFLERFSEIDAAVSSGSRVFLTGGSLPMVLVSAEEYFMPEDDIEAAIDEAEISAERSALRLTHEEVFGELRRKYHV